MYFRAGLFEEPPVIKTTTKLMSIKFQNNTHPRYGDMALRELRAAYQPAA